MIHIGLFLSALILFFPPHEKIIPIREAIRLTPRSGISLETARDVTVTGIVTVPSSRTDGSLQTFVQDRGAGIRLFEYDYRGPSLFVGDSVLVTGRLGIYYGQEEIVSPRIDLLRHRLKVYPVSATVEQVRDGTFHGLLIRCKGKTVRKVVSNNGIFIYFVNGKNDTAEAFADFRQDPQFSASKIHDGLQISITGISTRYSYKKPYTGNNDLLLRSSADITSAPEGFLDRYSSPIEFIFVLILGVIAILTVFTYLLRTKVRQKTRQLEDQARVLRLFFDSIAELTGVLDRKEILTLALKRGHLLAGTTSVIFGEALPLDAGLLLTAFEMPEDRLALETKRFEKEALSPVLDRLSGMDALWNTTVGGLVSESPSGDEEGSLLKFLKAHLHGSNFSVTSHNPQGKDFLVIFDHAGPISNAFPRALVKSYILHVYSAYRAAELFDLVKEQGTALERLYNNSVFGLLTFSEQGTIRTANKIALQMFEDGEMIGKKVGDYLAPQGAGRLDDLLASIASASKEKFVRFAAEIKKPHGQGDVEFAIQFDAGAKVFYATVQDTSDREYYESYSAKEKKIETLEKLASSLTHDLNNIVGSITGYASLLKRKLPQNSKEHHYADIIENSSRRTSELVKEVLGFAQLDAKTLEVVDLNRFAADVINDFKKTYGDKYSLLLTSFGRPILTRISTSQMRQVLLAVLTNAAESMENGGTIMCSVGLSEVPPPAPRYVKAGEHCFVEVEDHGLGMDDAIKRRIFEPFFTTKRVKKYTGLSLSMAYNIVKHHRGFIGVDSTSGIGTKVKIFLPCFSDKTKPAPEPKVSGSLDARGAKILVVDDEEGVRQLAYDILVEDGYSVITANDGLQALERLNENPDIKLVILDMVMPGMGGRDTCIEIKKKADPPKVLICTGYSELSDLESILGKHADGLIQKPYSTSEMTKAVQSLLSTSMP